MFGFVPENLYKVPRCVWGAKIKIGRKSSFVPIQIYEIALYEVMIQP